MRKKKMETKDRIIVALDVDHPKKAIALVNNLSPYVGYFKIGLQMTYVMLSQIIVPENEEEAIENLRVIRELFGLVGNQLFWDTKLDDIPNTVIGASEALSKIGVAMFNVHASCGIPAMMGCVDKGGGAMVLAVTVLTSLGEDNVNLNFGLSDKAKAIQFARNAKLAGCAGVVCSAKELPIIKNQKDYPELTDIITVTPGIRPKWSVSHDQKRITTPAQAIKDGADYLVIGRAITSPPEEMTPVDAAKTIINEIDEAVSS